MAWFTGQLLGLLAVAFVAGLGVGWLWWIYGSGNGVANGRGANDVSGDVDVDDLRTALAQAEEDVDRLRDGIAARDEALAAQRAATVDVRRLRAELEAKDRRLADLETAATTATAGGTDEDQRAVELLERLRERNDRIAALEQEGAERDAVVQAQVGELEAAIDTRDERIAEQDARLRDLDERLAERVEREKVLRADLAAREERLGELQGRDGLDDTIVVLDDADDLTPQEG